MPCDRCGSEQFTKAGRDRQERQLYRCRACGRRLTARSTSAFRGYRFPDDIIALAVRWYLRFRLSYADLAELLAERGVVVDPSTIVDGVQPFTPLYQEAQRSRRRRVGQCWSIDETYIRIAGRWCYAFRAIDEEGQVIDVYVSPTRDTAAATTFLTQAVESTEVTPTVATTDKLAIYPPALAAVLPEVMHIRGTMEQHRIERDHQHGYPQGEGRIRSMRGFQALPCAQVVCAGHGVMRNLRNGFYDLGVGGGKASVPQSPRLVRAWDALTVALAAA
jgi:transposase-like protein